MTKGDLVDMIDRIIRQRQEGMLSDIEAIITLQHWRKELNKVDV